jgi:hypothetical protein
MGLPFRGTESLTQISGYYISEKLETVLRVIQQFESNREQQEVDVC